MAPVFTLKGSKNGRFIKGRSYYNDPCVRGEVKVFPTTDDAERFLDIEYVLLDTGKELRRLNIQNVKFF